MDGDINTFVTLTGERAEVGIVFSCDVTVKALRIHRTCGSTSCEPLALSTVSVSQSTGLEQFYLSPSNTTGWTYPYAELRWRQVLFGFTPYLSLSPPRQAQSMHLTLGTKAGWTLNEVEVVLETAQTRGSDLLPVIVAPISVALDAPDYGVIVSIRNNGPDPAFEGTIYFSSSNGSVPRVDIDAGLTCMPSDNPTQCQLSATAPLSAGASRSVRLLFDPHFSGGGENRIVGITRGPTDSIGSNNRAVSYTMFTRDEGAFFCPLLLIYQTIVGGSSTALSKPGKTAEGNTIVAGDFNVLYRLRDEILSRSPAGKRYTSLYYGHGPEISRVLLANLPAAVRFLSGVEAWMPNVRALVDGHGADIRITSQQVDALSGVLEDLKRLGSADLSGVIASEQAALDLPSLIGKTMDDAVARQSQTVPPTLPAAASLHGVPPAFFHSDVSVFNPSRTTAASVTARYRCFTGACGDATQTLTLAPGEMRLVEDAPPTLFGAPETGGAIELDGTVIANSRLYTPSRPSPTTGMYVPGLNRAEAFSETVLLSLAQSAAFRTNIGVYNLNDQEQSVTITLFDPAGRELGRLTRTLAAKTPAQINNVFGAAGVTTNVDDAYAVVRSDGLHELFAYASVIDNHSQDAIFVRGRTVAAASPRASRFRQLPRCMEFHRHFSTPMSGCSTRRLRRSLFMRSIGARSATAPRASAISPSSRGK